MLSICEIYKKFDKIGALSFSTLGDDGYVESRIAHFFAYDDDGIYFRTMTVKPFYRQLKRHGKISVCGTFPNTRIPFDNNGLPLIDPGYAIRITGDSRELTMDEINEKAELNPDFRVAVYDIEKYPDTKIFVLYRARGEFYDYDYDELHRDHKLLRERFSFGEMTFTPSGLVITDKCTGCGVCLACTFDAITSGTPYKIDGARCDECGSCYVNCPVGAVVTR